MHTQSLALALALSLVACADDPSPADTPSDTAPVSELDVTTVASNTDADELTHSRPPRSLTPTTTATGTAGRSPRIPAPTS